MKVMLKKNKKKRESEKRKKTEERGRHQHTTLTGDLTVLEQFITPKTKLVINNQKRDCRYERNLFFSAIIFFFKLENIMSLYIAAVTFCSILAVIFLLT